MAKVKVDVATAHIEHVSGHHNKYYRSYYLEAYGQESAQAWRKLINQWGRRGAKGQAQAIAAPAGRVDHQETLWKKGLNGYVHVWGGAYTIEVEADKLRQPYSKLAGVLRAELETGFDQAWLAYYDTYVEEASEEGDGDMWALICDAEVTAKTRAPAARLWNHLGETTFEDEDPQLGVPRQIRRIPAKFGNQIQAAYIIESYASHRAVPVARCADEDNEAVMEMTMRLYDAHASGELATFDGALETARTLLR